MRSASLPYKPQVLNLLAIGLLALMVLRVWAAMVWPVPLSVDEAQYLVWSRDLQMGYYSKPPLIAWVLSIAGWSCSASGSDSSLLVSEGCVRWLQPMAIGLASLFVLATAHRLFDRWAVSLWAMALFLLAPLTSFYSQAATTDAWLLLWWSGALWAFVQALHHDRPSLYQSRAQGHSGLRWWVLCGLFAGLGLITKYSMAVFALSALIALIQQRRVMSAGPWVSGLIALVILTPNLQWNAHWDWPTLKHHADITLGQDHGLHPLGLLTFFGTQWATFSPLVFGMFLWGSLRRFGRGLTNRSPYDQQTTDGIRLLLAFGWPILAVVLLQSLLSRAHANWASPALVGMSLVVAAWWLTESASRSNRLPLGAQLGVWLSLLVNLVIGGLILLSPWLVQSWGLAGHRQTDPFVRLDGYKAVAAAVAHANLTKPVVMASDDRKLLANLSAYLPSARVYAYNPRREKDNHWQLQYDLRQLPPGSRVLLIQARPVPQSAAPQSAAPSLSDFSAIQRAEEVSPTLANLLQPIRLEGKADLGVVAHWVTLADSASLVEPAAQ